MYNASSELRDRVPRWIMSITVNGVQEKIAGPVSILEYLIQEGFEEDSVFVELNYMIPPREQWADIALEDGDNLQIFRLLGGG